MSFHRENVIWQGADGKWNRGFYATSWVGSEADGYDSEWDVEYDSDHFWTVTLGHPSEESAWKAWYGSNPGGYSSFPYGPGLADEIARFDAMAAEVKAKNERGPEGWYFDWTYNG